MQNPDFHDESYQPNLQQPHGGDANDAAFGQNLNEDIEKEANESDQKDNHDESTRDESTPLASLVSLATTMSMQKAIKKYPKLAKEAFFKELQSLVDHNTLIPVKYEDLSEKERKCPRIFTIFTEKWCEILNK